MHEADLVYENGVPKVANQRKILDSRDLPFSATLEPQNYRPPLERELIFSAYDYQQGEVFGVDLTTGKLTNYSNGPCVYDFLYVAPVEGFEAGRADFQGFVESLALPETVTR